MKKEIFVQILDKLKGINYFFISGMSVAIYSKDKRQPRDIDMVINEKDIDKFAKLMGTKASKRVIDKKTFKVNDYGFITFFNGQSIEATSGYPKKRILEKTFNKLFKLKIKKKYLDMEVFVEPIEELLTQKAFMHRKKDITDLTVLKKIKFNEKLLIKLAEDKGNKKKIIDVLKGVGFKIRI